MSGSTLRPLVTFEDLAATRKRIFETIQAYKAHVDSDEEDPVDVASRRYNLTHLGIDPGEMEQWTNAEAEQAGSYGAADPAELMRAGIMIGVALVLEGKVGGGPWSIEKGYVTRIHGPGEFVMYTPTLADDGQVERLVATLNAAGERSL